MSEPHDDTDKQERRLADNDLPPDSNDDSPTAEESSEGEETGGFPDDDDPESSSSNVTKDVRMPPDNGIIEEFDAEDEVPSSDKLIKENERVELTKEVARIDNWLNAGADNGLFLIKQNANIYTQIREFLKSARISLHSNDLPEAESQVSNAIQSYSEAVHSSSRWWRFSNAYAGYVWAYLIVFLSLILFFYIGFVFSEDSGTNPVAPYDILKSGSLSGVEDAAIHAVTWGAIGGILRGLWFLKDKVGDHKYRKTWRIYFLSVPFLGAIFGAIVYFVVVVGLSAFGSVQIDSIQDNNQGATSSRETDLPSDETSNADIDETQSGEVSNQAFGQTGDSTTENGPVDILPGEQERGASVELNVAGQENTSTLIKGGNLNLTNTKGPAAILLVYGPNISIQSETAPQNRSGGEGDQSNSGIVRNPIAIIPLAALAGFNWEWIVLVFKGIGERFSPGTTKQSFEGLLEGDLTKIDK
jgi:hypothetical protein